MARQKNLYILNLKNGKYALVIRVEHSNLFPHMVSFQRFNKFYNINSSLIEISKIIISNYFSSLKWANNIILTNYKRNINFTPMTELFAILKMYKERKSSSLPSALRTLLLNPLNNYIIKPKMIIPYYKVEYNKRVNHFCYLGNDEIVFNSNNSIYITNIYTNSIIKEFSFHNGIINCIQILQY